MNRNKIIINTTIISIVIIVLIPTLYTIIKKHNDRLMEVSTKRIVEAAKKCYDEEKCKSKKITLKELYDNKYLKKESNPITKKYYNEKTYIKKKNNDYKLIIVD
ncbi:MAG: hypothetical protein E7158_03695 [Firmicutes bacterium]|nr:hypothetical protein [Bacillota bacterium]